MKLKTLVAAGAIAASSLSSFAGSATFANGSSTFVNNPFSATGQFTQTITFSGLAAGLYDILGNISGTYLSFSSISLDGNSWNITNISSGTSNFSFGFLDLNASQPLTMILSGTASSNSAVYSGNITAVSPVPEPETYAMFLAGLGIMGTIARRRNKANSAT